MLRQTILFDGTDANGTKGLWESNGTAAGPREIGDLDSTGINGAYPNGFDPTDFTVYNGGRYDRTQAVRGHAARSHSRLQAVCCISEAIPCHGDT
jgi:hypothetical protein